MSGVTAAAVQDAVADGVIHASRFAPAAVMADDETPRVSALATCGECLVTVRITATPLWGGGVRLSVDSPWLTGLSAPRLLDVAGGLDAVREAASNSLDGLKCCAAVAAAPTGTGDLVDMIDDYFPCVSAPRYPGPEQAFRRFDAVHIRETDVPQLWIDTPTWTGTGYDTPTWAIDPRIVVSPGTSGSEVSGFTAHSAEGYESDGHESVRERQEFVPVYESDGSGVLDAMAVRLAAQLRIEDRLGVGLIRQTERLVRRLRRPY